MEAVLNWLWQGAIAAAVLLVLLRILARARANVRYVVCAVGLLTVLAIPAASWLLATSATRQTSAPPVVPLVEVPDSPWTSVMTLLALWLVWAGARSLRLCGALVSVRRARRRSRAFPTDVEHRLRHWMGVQGGRRARLALSGDVGSAAVLGCGTPLIAVSPEVVERLSADELDSVVIHEWAHVQRRDDLVNVLLSAVGVIAGWHPAVWLIDRRLRAERELACDETAVAVTGSAKSYATCLVKLADLSATRRTLLAAPAILAPGDLRSRVTRLLSGRAFVSAARSRGLAIAGVAVLVMLTAGVARFALFTSVQRPTVLAVAMSESAEPTSPRDARIGATSTPPPSRRSATSPVPAVAALPSAVPTAASDAVAEDVTIDAAPMAAAEEPDAARTQSVSRDREPADARTVAFQPTPAVAAPASGDQRSGETPADLRTPWVAAADAGTAIGQGSKTAGVATAGFFSRIARRVAGSL
jgi:beta-lactamase regulating signal transducer with metallopeptidase domain